jgi:hypothetical protein
MGTEDDKQFTIGMDNTIDMTMPALTLLRAVADRLLNDSSVEGYTLTVVDPTTREVFGLYLTLDLNTHPLEEPNVPKKKRHLRSVH